ncbi:MAG: hypothetical protein ACTS5G_01430 [Burkholderiales bacterium]
MIALLPQVSVARVVIDGATVAGVELRRLACMVIDIKNINKNNYLHIFSGALCILNLRGSPLSNVPYSTTGV